ncbi:TPR-like protein [Fomitiporia mediterranea MF3/22]|uniref:TPR-like protein n=1 Tax=Fomitiporia mediterranea (strain MF3/22) TaxID=694068 RepID=UPI000440816C|nr:TPR-like protein [Fomitiporia mediterranea MF3/22]EJD02275.1 TPR-like protein [Fomitiporia mediterranea MF3/22]
MFLVISRQFKQRRQVDNVEESIVLERAALERCPRDHPNRPMHLNNLAAFLHRRYKECKRSEDIEEAIKLHRAALELRPESHPHRSVSLNNLARSLHSCYEQQGKIEDLEEAIELHRAALELCPVGDPNRFTSLSLLAISLRSRYERRGRTEDFEEVIKLLRAALVLCPEGHPTHFWTLNLLAISLTYRNEQHGRTEDLEEAIGLYRAALESRSVSDPDRLTCLSSLATSLSSRYAWNGRTEDLNETIELRRADLKRHPEGHARRSASLSRLALSLRTRYQQQHGSIEDLNEAIEIHRADLELRHEGHPGRSISLINLAISLSIRFEQLGDPSDLEEAIELGRAALELRPEGHPRRFRCLHVLASSLRLRYEQHGRIEDLEEAIALQRAALELYPLDDPDRSTCLCSLAASLSTRYAQHERTEDLEEAIELNRATVELSKDHHDRSMYLNNLAISLNTRYNQHRREEDLEETIKLHRAALELRPEGHPHHYMSLINLASALFAQYQQHGRMEDLDKVIELSRTALEFLPEGHPHRSSSLASLAGFLYILVKQRWCTEEFEECIRLLELAATHRFSGSFMRLRAARQWAEIARSRKHDTTFAAYKATVSILQHALTVNPTLHSQHNFLLRSNEYRALTLDAASYAVEENQLEQAIVILEQGRGLLWSQLRGFRTPLDQLAETSKELVDRFRDVSGVKTDRTRFDELLKLKKRLSNEQEQVIDEIRRVPGFESFLKGSPFKELQQVASEGPVIVVNHCKYRSNALIILCRDDPSVICVPLDDDFYEDSIRLCQELVETRQRFNADSCDYDEKLREAMKMIWDRVVSKVIVELNRVGVAKGSRIWWCPTSVLSALPFHAAGPFEADGVTKYLLDDYTSSYTPTLGALINARSGGDEDDPTVLVIGDTSLRSAKQEISNIRNCGMTTKLLVGKKASRDGAIKAVQEATWVHFVCHGSLDSSPFNSSFNLSGRGLTMLDIIQTSLPNAEFAFLSACHTAEQPHNGAYDEVLHLAAAMQFSGFRSVIGSMWELLDKDGPIFAKTVYEYINECEEGGVKYKRAAEGLRKAALELKAREGIQTERWVNLVHIGA